MELRQIRSFLSIAETLHFGRTAEMIHLSQPAHGLQIRALEDEQRISESTGQIIPSRPGLIARTTWNETTALNHRMSSAGAREPSFGGTAGRKLL